MPDEEALMFSTIVDVNNDSLPDIIWSSSWGLSKEIYIAYNEIPSDSSFNVKKITMPENILVAYGDWDTGFAHMHMGFIDLNGDGYIDYVKTSKTKFRDSTWTVYYGKKDGFQGSTIVIVPPPPVEERHEIRNEIYTWFGNYILFTMDMNNDNKPDRVYFSDKTYLISYNNGNGFDKWKSFLRPEVNFCYNQYNYIALWYASANPFALLNHANTIFIDVDGDKCPDLLTSDVESKNWVVFRNLGDGSLATGKVIDCDLVESSKLLLDTPATDPKKHQNTFIDMNGDGLVDHVRTIKGDENYAMWEVRLNIPDAQQVYQLKSNEVKIRTCQSLLQRAHEAYFHEEYVQSLDNYFEADKLLGDLIMTSPIKLTELQQEETKLLEQLRELARECRKERGGGFTYSVSCAQYASVEKALKDIQQEIKSEKEKQAKLLARIGTTKLDSLILTELICDSIPVFKSYLIYICDFVLPLCLGDTYLEMGDYRNAETQYNAASNFEYLNIKIELKVLLLKFYELYIRQANELFRQSYHAENERLLRQQAAALYERIINDDLPMSRGLNYQEWRKTQNELQDVSNSLATIIEMKKKYVKDYRTPSVSESTDLAVAKKYLAKVKLLDPASNNLLPRTLNPLIMKMKLEAFQNLAKLEYPGNINYLGYDEATLPILRYSYLTNLTKTFAQHVTQLQREYINFKATAENETYTMNQLVQAIGLAQFSQLIEKNRMEQAAWETAISKMNAEAAKIREKAASDYYNDTKDKKKSASSFLSKSFEVMNAAISGASSGSNMASQFSKNKWAKGSAAVALAGYQGLGALSALSNQNTELSNEVNQAYAQYQQAQLAHDASVMQTEVAFLNQQLAMLQNSMAEISLANAQGNLAYMQTKEFNAELWFSLAKSVKELSRSYLDNAIELAWLMEKAYNFESGRNLHKIRLDYSYNRISGLLAGDYLLRDIESFEYERATQIKNKDIPIKHVISLASTRPFQFFGLIDSGKVSFATTLQEFTQTYPGAYNCRIKEIEVIIEGLLPLSGINGTLSNGCYSMVRLPLDNVKSDWIDYMSKNQSWRVHGAYLDTIKTHEMETMVLSKYAIREDRMVFTPPAEQTGIFENTGVASEWTLEIPKSSNNFDYNTLSDVKLVIAFTAQYDDQLAAMERKKYLENRNSNPENYEALTMFSARYQFPDGFYRFINSIDETQYQQDDLHLSFPLKKYYFPINELDFKTAEAMLVFFPPDSISGNTIMAELCRVENQDSTRANSATDKKANGIMTFTENSFQDESPVAEWVIKFPKHPMVAPRSGSGSSQPAPFQKQVDAKTLAEIQERARNKLATGFYLPTALTSLQDVWLCISYTSKIRQ
jgi:hypothetical protein